MQIYGINQLQQPKDRKIFFENIFKNIKQIIAPFSACSGSVPVSIQVHWQLFPSPRPVWMGGRRKKHGRGMGGDTGTERQLARSRGAIGYAVAKRQACAPWLVSTSRALPPNIRCTSRGCNRGMSAVSAGNHRQKQRPTREGIILYSSKGMDNDIKSPVVPMYSMMGNSCRRRLGIM